MEAAMEDETGRERIRIGRERVARRHREEGEENGGDLPQHHDEPEQTDSQRSHFNKNKMPENMLIKIQKKRILKSRRRGAAGAQSGEEDGTTRETARKDSSSKAKGGGPGNITRKEDEATRPPISKA